MPTIQFLAKQNLRSVVLEKKLRKTLPVAKLGGMSDEAASPKISVVVPVYKVEEYLRACVESVLAQSFRDFELILVDDGSPDRCGEICDELAKRDPRVRVFHQENGGVVLARRLGLRNAVGDYVFFLDSDDWIEGSCLQDTYSAALENDADFVVGDFIIDGAGRESRKLSFHDFGVADSRNFLIYCLQFSDFYHTGRLVRRSLLMDLDIPPDITYGEDNVAIVQIAAKLKTAVKVNKPILHYVQRETSVTGRAAKHDIRKRVMAIKLVEKFIRENFTQGDDLEDALATWLRREQFLLIANGVPISYGVRRKAGAQESTKTRWTLFASRFLGVHITCIFYGLLKRCYRICRRSR